MSVPRRRVETLSVIPNDFPVSVNIRRFCSFYPPAWRR